MEPITKYTGRYFNITENAPVLETLDLRNNNWQKVYRDYTSQACIYAKKNRTLINVYYAVLAVGWLEIESGRENKSLRKLDDEPVTEAEATAALRMAAGSRISQVSLLAHARTDAQPPANLSLLPNAQFLLLNSRNKPDRTGEQDNVWYSKVIMSLFGSFDIMLKSHVQSCFVRRWHLCTPLLTTG